VVYVIGLPGSGKTTMVNEAVERSGVGFPVLDVRVPHVRHGGLWHIGRPREDFGGTDTLSMSIQPHAIRWLDEIQSECDVLVGEGDRLANGAFFDACPNLTVVHLDTSLATARERVYSRARTLRRPPQNESWWKGRATKVHNLLTRYEVITLDGELPPEELADEFCALAGIEASSRAK
jgi:hypothetical protein